MNDTKLIFSQTSELCIRYFKQLFPLAVVSYAACTIPGAFYTAESEEDISLMELTLFLLSLTLTILASIFTTIYAYRLSENGTANYKEVFVEFKKKYMRVFSIDFTVTILILLGGFVCAMLGLFLSELILLNFYEYEADEYESLDYSGIIAGISFALGCLLVYSRYYFIFMYILFRDMSFKEAKTCSVQQTKNIRFKLIFQPLIPVILITVPLEILNTVLLENLVALPLVVLLGGLYLLVLLCVYLTQYKYYADRIKKD